MNSNLLTVSNDNIIEESEVRYNISLIKKTPVSGGWGSFLDCVFFWRSFGILKRGNAKSVELGELPKIREDIKYKRLIPELKEILKTPGISLYWAFTRLISVKLLLFFMFCLIGEIIGILIPFVLRDFINEFDGLVRGNDLKKLNCKYCVMVLIFSHVRVPFLGDNLCRIIREEYVQCSGILFPRSDQFNVSIRYHWYPIREDVYY